MMLEIQIAFVKFLSLQSLLISWGLVGWLVSGILCYDDRAVEEIDFG